MKIISATIGAAVTNGVLVEMRNDQVCYPVLGCFDHQEPYDCLGTRHLPTNPNTMTFEYRNYVTSSQYRLLKYDDLDSISWVAGNKILLATHGWHDSFNGWLRETREFSFTQPNLTFIALDWRKEAEHMNYAVSIQEARLIARAGAMVLQSAVENGIDPSDIHVTGHSLGGQLISFLCKEFQSLTGETLGRFTPLDAAGPVFDSCSSAARVDKTDATYVDFIHTDSGKLPALAMKEAVGDADFYINDGRHQPGCPEVALDTNCDHQRAVRMWTSSFTEPCIACPCQSYADLLSEQCDNCISQNTVGYWSIKKSEQPTTYYIRTTDKRPYCKYGP